MIRELKTWIWECSICREVSAPIRSFGEPKNPPAGWERTFERHCDDHRCSGVDSVDRCPECLEKIK